jgi:hypothetical protein
MPGLTEACTAWGEGWGEGLYPPHAGPTVVESATHLRTGRALAPDLDLTEKFKFKSKSKSLQSILPRLINPKAVHPGPPQAEMI